MEIGKCKMVVQWDLNYRKNSRGSVNARTQTPNDGGISRCCLRTQENYFSDRFESDVNYMIKDLVQGFYYWFPQNK
jgi:hypothetical protein